MDTKVIVGGVVVVLILGGVYLFAMPGGQSAPGTEVMGNEAAGTSQEAMRAEENMVVVMEQKPGPTITGSAIVLKEPGYLVIHEDNGGAPGAIIGASALLPADESSRVVVTLSRPSKHGEVLHAMLHNEKGGNTAFSAAEDTPVQSRLGGPISGFFNIADDAPEDMPITL